MSKPPAISTDRTLFVRDHCLCLAAQRAARALSRRFDEAFRGFGVTSGQFSLLNALNRPVPPSIGSVAELLVMDRTTLTANLKALTREGLIEMAADARDRRVRRLALTEAGRDRLALAMPVWTAMHGAIDDSLAAQAIDGKRLRADLALLA